MKLTALLFLITSIAFSQIIIPSGTDISTFNTASEGDLYEDSDGEIYIGLSNGTLKIVPKEPAESLPPGATEVSVSNPLIWLDTSASTITSSTNTEIKSFNLAGGILSTNNAVRIVCWRRRGNGNIRLSLRYGGSTFFETTDLGNSSSRVEFIMFGTGSTNSQRAYIDDANTGGNGQKTGTTSINSENDALVQIFGRRRTGNNSQAANTLDFCSAEALIFE